MPPITPHPAEDDFDPYMLGMVAPARRRVFAAIAGIFARTPVRDIDLEQLAAAAKLPVARFTEMFPTVEGALVSTLGYLAHRPVEQASGSVEPRGWPRLEATLDSIFGGLAHDSAVDVAFMIGVDALDPDHPAHEWLAEHQHALRASFEAALRTGIEDGNIVPTIDPLVASHVLAALVLGSVPAWSSKLEAAERRAVASEITALARARYYRAPGA